MLWFVCRWHAWHSRRKVKRLLEYSPKANKYCVIHVKRTLSEGHLEEDRNMTFSTGKTITLKNKRIKLSVTKYIAYSTTFDLHEWYIKLFVLLLIFRTYYSWMFSFKMNIIKYYFTLDYDCSKRNTYAHKNDHSKSRQPM